jgi:predicted naringenin-chalcone synthase
MYFICSSIVLEKNKARPSTEEQKTPNITIQRTSGRLEKFSVDKMALDISRSGAPYLLAKEISTAISNKIHEKALKNDVIDAKEVR